MTNSTLSGTKKHHKSIKPESCLTAKMFHDGFHTKQHHFPLSSAPLLSYRFEVSQSGLNCSLKNYGFLCDAIYFFKCTHAHILRKIAKLEI